MSLETRQNFYLEFRVLNTNAIYYPQNLKNDELKIKLKFFFQRQIYITG